MGYCLMTLEKVKTYSTMAHRFSHNFRQIDVPNAIDKLKDKNEELIKLEDQEGAPANYIEAFQSKIKSLPYYQNHGIRKNAILGYEVVLTFSHDDKEKVDIEQWKKDNVKWLKETFDKGPDGFGGNCVSAMFHGDEYGNAHIHAFVIPIDNKGHLNAHDYTGGRAKMIALQDSYAKAMESHGLERGIRGSTAKHKAIRKFYTELNQKLIVPEVLPNETAMEYRTRISEFIQEERASGYRDLQTMITKKRQKMDKERQLYIDMAKNAGMAEYNSNVMENNKLVNANRMLKQMNKELDEALDEAREKSDEIPDLDELMKKAEAYDQEQAVMAYNQIYYPELYEEYEKNISTMQTVYDERLPEEDLTLSYR